MDAFKAWLIQVGIKKMGPSLIRAALAWVVALIAAHSGMLETFGVVYDKVAHTVTLHIDTLESWLLGGGLGMITAAFAAAQHHTVASVKGEPQSGDPALEARRATDPPKEDAPK